MGVVNRCRFFPESHLQHLILNAPDQARLRRQRPLEVADTTSVVAGIYGRTGSQQTTVCQFFTTGKSNLVTTQFKKAIVEIAWGSYVWLVSEPDHIINLRNGQTTKLSELI